MNEYTFVCVRVCVIEIECNGGYMLVFISETHCILCDVGREFSNVTKNFMFKN